LTLEEVFHSYMIVSGTERSAAYQDRLMLRFFQSVWGRNRPIKTIKPRDISNALGVLRDRRIKRKGVSVPLSPSTLNRHTQFLQRIWAHAEEALGESVERIRWKSFLAVEPEARIYPLTKDEEEYVITTID
jgi:hypothetical protein